MLILTNPISYPAISKPLIRKNDSSIDLLIKPDDNIFKVGDPPIFLEWMATADNSSHFDVYFNDRFEGSYPWISGQSINMTVNFDEQSHMGPYNFTIQLWTHDLETISDTVIITLVELIMEFIKWK